MAEHSIRTVKLRFCGWFEIAAEYSRNCVISVPETLHFDRHACRRNLAPLMMEIRHDLIQDQISQDGMAHVLARVLLDAVGAL